MISKKKISIVTILLAAFLLLASSTVVQAAVNPLAKMPRKDSGVANTAITGKGWNFMTPEYSSKVKIQVKSYNPKVATIKGHTAQNSSNIKYYAGYEIFCVSPGTAKLKVIVTVNSKSYTKICNYTVYKWENPFKTLKIGSKNYLPKFNKSGYYVSQKDISGQVFSFKINPNYTFVGASCLKNNPFSSVQLKPGNNVLPKNAYSVSVRVESKKNGHFYTINIHIPQNSPY